MIISISGRMQSGKTLLANEMVNNGYTIFSFAESLKEIISILYNLDIAALKDPAKKNLKLEIPLPWNKEIASKLFEITNIKDYNFPIENREFYYLRDCMQYIGTDILRKYDDNFHIKKTVEKIDISKNYICDDVRYPNELLALKNLGAKCIYLIRPNNFEISNHVSETSINWTHCDTVIINNCKKDSFIKKFNKIINNFNRKHNNRGMSEPDLRFLLKKYNYDTVAAANELKCSRDKIVWWANSYGIYLDHHIYFNDKKSFLEPSSEAAYYAGLLSANGCIKKSGKSKTNYVVELTSKDESLVRGLSEFVKTQKPIYERQSKINNNKYYSIIINCPFIIENLKYWNIKPRKNRVNEIPDIIKYDDNLMNYWVVGLIDGNGSIYNTKQNNNIHISILASEQIIDFINNKYNINCCKSSEKNIDNLFSLKYTGKYAVELYKIIYNDIGLARKWDKLALFERTYRKTIAQDHP